jgi:hypothetical protein
VGKARADFVKQKSEEQIMTKTSKDVPKPGKKGRSPASSPGDDVSSPTLPLPPPREGHSLAGLLDQIEGFVPNFDHPGPLPPEIVRDLPIVAAEEPIDTSFQSRSAKTFWLPKAYDECSEVRRSSLAEGAWELNVAPTEWGLPGRSFHTLTHARVAEKTVSRRAGEVGNPGFAPRSAALSVHPRVSPPRYRRRFHRGPNGRLYRLSGDPPHVQIYGSDDRFEIYPNNYPAFCVCHLIVSMRMSDSSPWVRQGEGTGFLAGRRVCVTASHLWPEGRFSGWKIDVVPGEYVVGVSTLGFSSHTTAHSALRAPAEIGTDIMVLGLYDAIGDVAGYFGTTAYTDDWEDWNVWSMVGYPYDHPGVPTAQIGIAVYDDDNGPDTRLPGGDVHGSLQIESYADEASGMSGAPLFSWFEDGMPYAIGVHHGRELVDYVVGEDRNSVASGGGLLNAMVWWARNTWD